MRTIIFDIETSSYPFETLAESQKEYILRYAEKEKSADLRNQKREEAIRYTSLYPFTAEVIAIGIFDVEKRLAPDTENSTYSLHILNVVALQHRKEKR